MAAREERFFALFPFSLSNFDSRDEYTMEAPSEDQPVVFRKSSQAWAFAMQPRERNRQVKRTITQIILSASLGLASQAQTNIPPPPDWSAWTVTAMDDCSTTREFKGSVTNGLTGVVTPRSSRIIELATGLNFQDSSGVWTESQDLIESLTNGGAAAVHGRYSAYFSPAGLNDDAALTITTPTRVYQARVLGIYYFDTQSGQSNLLAAPSDAAVAEILPPNQIVFRGAFNSPKLKADLRYTYTKAAFECDVIITSQPKVSPADCGLNPDTTLIQVRHQWLGAPMPGIQEVTVAQGPGPVLVDQILDFGDLWFPRGRAFAWGDGPGRGTNAAQISLPGMGVQSAQPPVAKEWQAAGSKAILTESVTWDSIAPMLAQLPTMAKVAKDPKEARMAAAGLQEAVPNVRAAARRIIQVAARAYRTRGVGMDLITGVTGTGSYHFYEYSPSGPLYNPSGGTTYKVKANCFFNDTLTFDAGCVVKFEISPLLLTYGGVICNYISGIPSVLTSTRDPVYGDPIDPGTPSQAGNPALGIYINTNVALSGMTFRYSYMALELSANNCSAVTDTVANCSFYSCQAGIAQYECQLTIQNSTCCDVTTPLNPGSCSYSGSLTVCNSPAITTAPLCQFVLPNNSVSFTAAASPTNGLTYTWSLDASPTPLVAGTNTSATITPLELGTGYGGHKVHFYATAPYGSGEAAAWVGIVDSSALAVANHWTNYTNNKSCVLWNTRTTNNPPTLVWNPNCLLYGKTGFTAISQRNEFEPAPGQCPVTALTRRHGYTRGHGMGFTNGYAGFNSGFNTQNVYFCTSSNTLVTATVTNGYTRYSTTNGFDYDYTILVFSADLPSSIQPMEVSYTNPTSFSVVFNTTQQGYMSANNPPFWLINSISEQASDPDAFPPFNEYPTFLLGDSGSPVMVPWTDDYLVFLYGDTTTAPCDQMQLDMNNLCTSVGIEGEDYQMTVHSVQ